MRWRFGQFEVSVAFLLLITIDINMVKTGADGGDSNSDQNPDHEEKGEGEGDLEEVDDVIEFGFSRLQTIIRIYNFTESIEEKYAKLRKLDPYGEARTAVATVTEKMKTLSQHYEDVHKMLAKKSTREPGKRIFDNLYHQFLPLQKEIDDAKDLVRAVEARKKTDIAEEAIILQEALKLDLRNITKDLRRELVDCVRDLEALQLLPENVLEFDEGDKWPMNTLPFVDRQALDGLFKLFVQTRALDDKIAEAFLQDEPVAADSVMELEEELTRLTEKAIPAFVADAEYRRALSRVLLITTVRFDLLEPRIQKLDVEASLLNVQDDVMGQVFESLAVEVKNYNKAYRAAEKIYKKYYDFVALRNSKPPPSPPSSPFSDSEPDGKEPKRDEL